MSEPTKEQARAWHELQAALAKKALAKKATAVEEVTCPKCGSADWNPADEGSFPSCNDCGFVQYDEYTLALQAEVQREQKVCKQILGYTPSYNEAVEKGLIRS